MNHIARLALLGCLLVTSAIAADAPNWTLFGWTEDTSQFFAMGDVERLPNGNLQVWTKGLSVEQVNSAVDRAAKSKDDRGRMVWATIVAEPAISQVKHLNQDELFNAAIEEDVANHSDLQPVTRVLYEVDCSNKLMRALSVYARKNGKSEVSNHPGEWMHIPPETNAANLHALLCGKKQQ